MSSNAIKVLFDQNRQWATSVEAVRPGFFSRLIKRQNPEYLWIGCSDSRVPANEIVGLESGELFVHRNIANVVVPSDLNCLSVIQFALESLKVKHIMVVGHYACSGVHVALNGLRVGLADNWLRHVKDVRDRHLGLLERVEDDQLRHNALCELNALEQAVHVCNCTVVQDAWARGQEVTVHGLVYALHNGLMQDLGFAVSNPQQISELYEHAVHQLYQRFNKALDA